MSVSETNACMWRAANDDHAYADNVYWVFGMVLSRDIDLNVDVMLKKMGEYGIGTRPFFYSMHLQPVFQRMELFEGESYPVAEYIAEKGFYVPSGLTATEKQVQRVADVIETVLAEQ